MIFWIVAYFLFIMITSVGLMICFDAEDLQDRMMCFALSVIWPAVFLIVGVVILVKLLGMIADKIKGETNEG